MPELGPDDTKREQIITPSGAMAGVAGTEVPLDEALEETTGNCPSFAKHYSTYSTCIKILWIQPAQESIMFWAPEVNAQKSHHNEE